MRAVNLIPADQRRGGDGPPYAALGLLGGLVVVLAAITVLVVTGNQVRDRQARLAEVTTQATAAEQQAQRLAPYTRFAKLEKDRLATVRSLAATRFQWSRAFGDVSRVMDGSVWLTGLTGTVAPGVTLEGSATSATGQFRSASTNPAVELAGCARTNKAVVRLMSRLRAMTGVQRVTLADATKQDSAAGGAGTSDGGCGSVHAPDFHIVVFYAPLAGPPASSDAAPGATASTTSTTSTGSSGSSSSSDSSTVSSGGTP